MQRHWSSISSTPAGHRSDEHSFHRKLYIDSNTHLSNTHLATLPPPPPPSVYSMNHSKMSIKYANTLHTCIYLFQEAWLSQYKSSYLHSQFLCIVREKKKKFNGSSQNTEQRFGLLLLTSFDSLCGFDVSITW